MAALTQIRSLCLNSMTDVDHPAAVAAAAADPAPASASSPPMRLYVHSVINESYGAWPEYTWAINVATGANSPTFRRIKQLFKEELLRRQGQTPDKALLRIPVVTAGFI